MFDLYLPTSIKSSERSRRQNVDPIEVTISNPLTPIPVELDQFWASFGNKQRFQQFFINWFITNNKKCIPVYLGGGHKESLFKCLRIDSTRKVEEDKSLYNEYEEADSRLLFHITQSVQYCSFNRVSLVTSDTDVFVSLIHHFHAWQLLGLKELLMVCGSGTSKRTINIHSLIDALPTHLPGILPVVDLIVEAVQNYVITVVKQYVIILLTNPFQTFFLFYYYCSNIDVGNIQNYISQILITTPFVLFSL